MSLTQNIKVLQILSVFYFLISTCSCQFNEYVVLNNKFHEESTDFVPMLFKDPRFPQRPQMLFVPIERKRRPVRTEEPANNPNDDDFLQDDDHPHYEDDHHHIHHHYHHDHYDTDAEQQQN